MRANQRGSVLSFVIIGVVLVAIAIGAVYYARHQHTASDTTGSGSDSSKQTGSEDQSGTASDQDKSGSSADTSQSNQSSSDSTSGSKTDSSSDTASNGSSDSSATPAEIPQTGPDSPLVAALMLGTLAGSVVLYVRSRHGSTL